MNAKLPTVLAEWHDPIVQEPHDVRESCLKNTTATFTRILRL